MSCRALCLSCFLLLLIACNDGVASSHDASVDAAALIDAPPRDTATRESGTLDAKADARSGDSDAPRPDAADPWEAQRQQCVDTINELRASLDLPPFERWYEEERCADLHAEDDQATGMPHHAWRTRKFGCTSARNQNECLGGSVGPCIQSMWRERDLPGCANCDACPGDHGCEGCDFYGDRTGNVCGHYENLSATSWTRVACGFGGGWIAINFR